MGLLQTYFLYYILVIFTSIVVFFSIKIKQSKLSPFSKVVFWSAVFLPVLVSGLRYGAGTDYFAYESIYYQLTSFGSVIENIINTRYEPGWIALNHFVKLIFNDVKYIFIISSILILVLNFKAIRDNRNYIHISIAILILMCTLYFPSFNTVRQSLAAAILMLSVKPIIERMPVKFVLTVFIATCFHYTALIFLPVYWIVNTRIKSLSWIKKMIAIIGAVLSVLLAPTLLSFITSFEVFSFYDSYELESGNFGIGNIILKLPIILIILANIKRLKNHNPIYKLVIIYFISVILEFYGYFAEYIGRISIYYEMMQIFVLSSIVIVQNNKYKRLFYSSFIAIYFLVLFTYNIIIQNYHQTIPYNWI